MDQLFSFKIRQPGGLKSNLLEIRCAEHVIGSVDRIDYWSEALIFDNINFFIGIIDITYCAVINIPKKIMSLVWGVSWKLTRL